MSKLSNFFNVMSSKDSTITKLSERTADNGLKKEEIFYLFGIYQDGNNIGTIMLTEAQSILLSNLEGYEFKRMV